MSALSITQGEVATMTSKELADLTEKRHDNVKRTIESLAEKGVIASPQIEEKADTGGRPGTEYRVGKRDSYIIVAQLSPEFTARLVDRWQELEAAKPAIDFNDAVSLRNMLLGYTEQVIELQHQVGAANAVIEKQAPKVEAFDRIATVSEGSFCLTDAAKLLQVQPKHLIQSLQSMGWIHRRPMGTGWLAYQTRIQQGLLEHKVTTGEKSDGHEWVSTQVRITAKGLSKLSELPLQKAA